MTQGNKFRGFLSQIAAIAALLLLPSLASAQTRQSQGSVTLTDIQRLQDDVYQAGMDLSRLRGSDTDTAARLQGELDDLRDEVIYLKVRLRKEGSLPRGEYVDVRDRVAALRARARGDATTSGDRRGTWQPPAGTGTGTGGVDDRRQSGTSSIPAGQEIDVRLESQLYSDTAQVEDRFEATTVVDLYRGNEVLIPAGSVLRGVVRTVEKASRTDRKGSLTVAFDQITVRGRTYPMRGTVTQALESEGIKGEAARVGAGAGIGAIIGGILGGAKGALLGVLIGGGGTIAATEGTDVKLPAGTVLRVRLDTPPNVR
jgi:hypothetical protein